MADESLKKFDRIVSLLIQLQSKKVVKAQELADRFKVSLRTIYRDIKSLESAGVPLWGDPGVGYSIMEGYKLPPVMFTKEEAAAFIAAGKLMKQFSDQSLDNHFQSALYKVKAILRYGEKDFVEDLDTNIHVRPAYMPFNENVKNALELLMKGIAGKSQVNIRYKSVNSEIYVERNIEPIGLYHDHGNWYLLAYCHYRNDYRNFRTDRIDHIRMLETPFTKTHQSFTFYLQQQAEIKNGFPPLTIRLLMDKSTAGWLQYRRKYFGFISQIDKEDMVEMKFEYTDNPLYFARWLMAFADQVTILEPESIKEQLLCFTEKIMQQLQK